jgi:hypothetical protein
MTLSPTNTITLRLGFEHKNFRRVTNIQTIAEDKLKKRGVTGL